MVNTTINNIGKKLPPVKTGQRFGEKVQNNKKVGLFSERRFLIFTKKGPIEIAFKPIHYCSAIVTTIVGLTSILYWSAKGIYSAIDVAQKNDIITEASANLNNPIENDSDTLVNINTIDQSNITFPISKKPPEKSNNSISYELIKKNDPIKDTLKKYDSIDGKTKSKSLAVKDVLISNTKKKKKPDDLVFNNNNIKFDDIEAKQSRTKKSLPKLNHDQFHNIDDVKSSTKNNELPQPPKLNKKVKSLRFVASVDNELMLMENVFKKIKVKVNNNDLVSVRSVVKRSINLDPESVDFFTSLKERLNLLAIYKDALQFIPLKPPMEHYYVSSPYGKRKHPVTGKYRMHHGIDLAGTWQENVSVSADGTVVFAGYHGSFGKVIRIKHNYGIMTTYGHLAKINVRRGDLVNEGQVIGKMGKTGRVNGAHLHYEISVNGKSQNPAIFIKIGRSLLSRTSLRGIANKN
ncbi:M23 family metallopeptidase [Alphaproteobacteria bacterium]|nr:M23 family metallopeptidase [Alphaproteobacteria bacterium]